MSGLIKAKQYDWKDSNLALFGSDTEKQVKKESANTEPAWKGAGTKVGLQIWRIVKFKVTPWPKEDYGKFFSGDSYIILNTFKPDPNSEALDYDVHFWIGSGSSQDEFVTAAYKTVELDTYLDDAAIQHREVQGRESDLFRDYFKSITIMEGGAESGFRHVKPEEYKPRLLHFSGQGRKVTVKEVPASKKRLNDGDVFILDLGLKLYQWNGAGSSKDERFKAMQFLSQLKSERGTATSETLDQADLSPGHDFYDNLSNEDVADEEVMRSSGKHELYRVSDASGSLDISKVKEGDVGMGDFDSGDVYILDIGTECFVWVGSGASDAEKKNGFAYAHKHLSDTNHALIPVSVIKEGQHSTSFQTAIAA